ncbi:hypothetical protein EVAR_3929_1 [Eumeta japonica]|uniref:Uncharacterized protein n=1 Tax=Eumeta variegata TaxID=151549 RepID=A0A4C1SU51_EUMVA|nr:hypothetical protein EVAR_3929_1 [Eumeta japonica]
MLNQETRQKSIVKLSMAKRAQSKFSIRANRKKSHHIFADVIIALRVNAPFPGGGPSALIANWRRLGASSGAARREFVRHYTGKQEIGRPASADGQRLSERAPEGNERGSRRSPRTRRASPKGSRFRAYWVLAFRVERGPARIYLRAEERPRMRYAGRRRTFITDGVTHSGRKPTLFLPSCTLVSGRAGAALAYRRGRDPDGDR